MKFVSALFFFVLAALSGRGQSAIPVAKPQRPIPAVQHVLIISIDGLRPDRALLADMPKLRSLLKQGAYTFWAKTTAVSITLPSHVSMLTGVTPGKHGIEWNRVLPFKEPVYPNVPTIFEMATRAGYTAAMVAGKAKFSTLAKPGTVMCAEVPDGNTQSNNEAVVLRAVELIETKKPDLLFVHFPDADAVGHALGWGSPEQLACIEKTDRQLGELLAALDCTDLRASTFIIITADHGGAGLTHGADDARSRHIPWIAVGPGVRKNFDLTTSASLEVRTEDTCATACYLLGLRQAPYFDGHPVMLAFEVAP
ncbi:MAG: alkaline phosphatase family protein [Verrucomicrobia bacterium]|nr:alkaline phosphatase family protein [Verrucomicrobiota bacterium]